MKECMFKKAERNTVKGYGKFYQQTVQNNICQISLVKFESVRSLKLWKINLPFETFWFYESYSVKIMKKLWKKKKRFTGVTV